MRRQQEHRHIGNYSYVAIKICAAGVDPRHELDVHDQLPAAGIGQERHVIQLLDSFSLHGPNGTHVVLVHDVLGNLRDLVPQSLPPKQVRQLCRQIVQGVTFLHARGIAHGGKFTISSLCTVLIFSNTYRFTLWKYRCPSTQTIRALRRRYTRLLRASRGLACPTSQTTSSARITSPVHRRINHSRELLQSKNSVLYRLCHLYGDHRSW